MSNQKLRGRLINHAKQHIRYGSVREKQMGEDILAILDDEKKCRQKLAACKQMLRLVGTLKIPTPNENMPIFRELVSIFDGLKQKGIKL